MRSIFSHLRTLQTPALPPATVMGNRFIRHHQSLPSPPWEVRLHQNQLINRFVVDALGYSAWSVVLARNGFERLEKLGDWLAWIAAGLLLPVAILTPFAQRVDTSLRRRYQLPRRSPATLSLLELPLESLEAGLRGRQKRLSSFEKSTLTRVGLSGLTPLRPSLAKSLLHAKMAILATDLVILAAKGQGYAWVKNALTEKLSGKKGYSGEFNTASDAYRERQTEGYEAAKTARMRRSIVIGFASAIALPVLLWATVRSPNRRDPLVAFCKRQLPLANYADAIFMSKWVLLWHNLFNWTLPTLLASRDKHELRENAVKLATFDLLFFFGDDAIAGVIGKRLQRRHRRKLPFSIVKNALGPFGLRWTRLRPLHQVYRDVQGDTKSLAYQLTRKSSWGGLLGTSLIMGVTIPLLNMWYTRRSIVKDQGQA